MPTDTKSDLTAEAKRAAREATRDAARRSSKKLHEVLKYPHPVLAKKGEHVTEFNA